MAVLSAHPRPTTVATVELSIPQVVLGVILLAVVVIGVVTYFSYRWLVSRFQQAKSPCTEGPAQLVLPPSPGVSAMAAPASTDVTSPQESKGSIPSLKISHSLPDIKGAEEPKEWRVKKVAPPRQTTLPTVPTRHQTFQRQLSHRLDLTDVPFEVCNLPQRECPGVGKIKPELYKPELIRQTSMEGLIDEPAGSVCGKLHFTLRYDHDVEGLIVRVLQAHDLPAKDFSGTSDPYIKIYLLPDRKKKFQTRVHRKNLNPVFNETFVFGAPFDQLRTRKLQFSIYDFDRFSRHDLIGQVVVKGLVDLCDFVHEMEYIMDIIYVPTDQVDLGELMLSLCYLPTAGRLTVTVLKARNLKAMDITGFSDPYVKVSLMCQGKRIRKKKTTVKRSTLNPVYNEALVFDVPAESIEEVTLIVKVVDYDRVGANELMGCTALGTSCMGLGRDQWLEMLDNPRKPVAQWYPLVETLPGGLGDLNRSNSSSIKCISIR